MKQSIILLSLKESFKSIYTHKLIFVLLAILEIIFIISFGVVQFKYQIKIIENSRDILEYYQQLNLEEDNLGKSMREGSHILGSDPLLIYKKFKELVSLTIILISSTVSLILFFNSLNWSITNLIFTKQNIKDFIRHFWRILIINLTYILLMALVMFLVFQKFYLELISKNPVFLIIGTTLLLVILYFMLISFSLANQKIGKLIKNSFSVGLKKAHYIFSIYILGIILLVSMGILILFLQNHHIILLLLAVVIFIASLITFRIFLITIVRNLTR